jgi:hypothetical protein
MDNTASRGPTVDLSQPSELTPIESYATANQWIPQVGQTIVMLQSKLFLALELLREFKTADDCLTAEELCDKFSVIILRLNRSGLLEAGK